MANLIRVKSSNIAAIGYEPDDMVLTVQFKNGGIFAYQGVPAQEVVNLHGAESVGKYLHSKIKPNFQCSKVGTVKND
ncbi:MAG: KTSC domain-containing protein [Smithella sp.]|nr:KTSC domain-containing protein [Smithella sp.]